MTNLYRIVSNDDQVYWVAAESADSARRVLCSEGIEPYDTELIADYLFHD